MFDFLFYRSKLKRNFNTLLKFMKKTGLCEKQKTPDGLIFSLDLHQVDFRLYKYYGKSNPAFEICPGFAIWGKKHCMISLKNINDEFFDQLLKYMSEELDLYHSNISGCMIKNLSCFKEIIYSHDEEKNGEKYAGSI